MSVICVSDLQFFYKGSDKPTLNGVSCSFDAGSISAIIGPSGSGKSTFLHLLAGLEMPTAGTIEVNGKNLASCDLSMHRRSVVSMVFQHFYLLPYLTVLENVCYPMQLQGIGNKECQQRGQKDLLRVGIQEEQFKRFPSHLSGGEQQRVAIARSLASGARIILADEPTGNLDGENTEKSIDILISLARDEGYCIIIVTHDMDVAGHADVVLRMKDGILIRER